MITSTSNNTIKEYKKLKQKKYRDQVQLFMIEGEHLVQEAIKHKALNTLITTDESIIDFDNRILVSSNVFEALSNQQSSSGLIGICSYLDCKVDTDKDIIALDNVQDPGNVGTILRNALAFNYKNILISNDSVDIYNPKCIQASQGSFFDLNIERVNLLEVLPELKKSDYTLIGTSLSKAQALTKDITLTSKNIITFGNEGSGMKEEILNLMDINYFIPISGIDSLNVASASAIMMYQLNKKD